MVHRSKTFQFQGAPSSLAIAAAILSASCAVAPGEKFDEISGEDQALVISGVTFQTTVVPRFLGATNNGGSTVVATATTAQAWETFKLDDVNGGALESGDAVFIQAGGGQYFQAVNGGGSTLNAASASKLGWETFKIVRQAGAGVVKNGDIVGLQASTGSFVRPVNGGGAGVDATGAGFGGWEAFKINGLAATPPPVTGDPTCSTGILNGTACCPAACGACGGTGCGSRPGGTAACCTGPITTAAVSCSGSKPPCVVSGTPPVITPTAIAAVSLRTTTTSNYVGATNNGGAAVTVSSVSPQAWETFSLIDLNGGTLASGDSVQIKTGGGQFFQALNGGGSSVSALGATAGAWETFKIVKQTGTGAITSGTTVGLQATSGAWLSATNGGGSTLVATGSSLQAWESFVYGVGITTPPPPSGWNLVWADEFNGTSLDESKWVYEVQAPGWVNNEKQRYTSRRPENVRVENGHLVIEGRRDYFSGSEYSSGRIKTQGKASWTYGRIESRLQVPTGFGTWPAFWMMPDNQSRGWPACGEIDIMEHVGYDPDVIHATTHTLTYNWKGTKQRTTWTSVPGATSSYKVYAIEWFADRLDFYVDGRKYYTSPNDYTGDDAWPFNKNFHIIFNLAIGGDWGGAQGIDPNIWPKQMLVDYVRVYQR